MQNDLKSFLSGREPFVTAQIRWGYGIELSQNFYAGGDLPPEAYISSVRAVLLKGKEVLVFCDKQGTYHLRRADAATRARRSWRHWNARCAKRRLGLLPIHGSSVLCTFTI